MPQLLNISVSFDYYGDNIDNSPNQSYNNG